MFFNEEREKDQQAIIDEREAPPDELTLLHFVADYIRCSESRQRLNSYWLCCSEDVQKEWLDRVTVLFEAWHKEEIEMKEARENMRSNGPYSKLYVP